GRNSPRILLMMKVVMIKEMMVMMMKKIRVMMVKKEMVMMMMMMMKTMMVKKVMMMIKIRKLKRMMTRMMKRKVGMINKNMMKKNMMKKRGIRKALSYPKTPKNSDDEGNGEEDLGLNIGGVEGHVEEEEEDEIYKDVNINQGRGIQATLEVEDSHVTLTPINPDGQQ
nr:hypothetical protein [Tanacetum cinerariifolium]